MYKPVIATTEWRNNLEQLNRELADIKQCRDFVLSRYIGSGIATPVTLLLLVNKESGHLNPDFLSIEWIGRYITHYSAVEGVKIPLDFKLVDDIGIKMLTLITLME